MDVRKTTNEYRTHQWSGIIKECRNSGMSIRWWCKEQSINEKSFYYWQRKLREAACTELENNQGNATEPAGWTKLSPVVRSCETALSIEINGCRVIVNSDTDPELIAKVCRSLKSL